MDAAPSLLLIKTARGALIVTSAGLMETPNIPCRENVSTAVYPTPKAPSTPHHALARMPSIPT